MTPELLAAIERQLEYQDTMRQAQRMEALRRIDEDQQANPARLIPPSPGELLATGATTQGPIDLRTTDPSYFASAERAGLPPALGFAAAVAEPDPFGVVGDIARVGGPALGLIGGLPRYLRNYFRQAGGILNDAGDPRVFIHGTPTTFSDVDPSKLGRGADVWGRGYYTVQRPGEVPADRIMPEVWPENMGGGVVPANRLPGQEIEEGTTSGFSRVNRYEDDWGRNLLLERDEPLYPGFDPQVRGSVGTMRDALYRGRQITFDQRKRLLDAGVPPELVTPGTYGDKVIYNLRDPAYDFSTEDVRQIMQRAGIDAYIDPADYKTAVFFDPDRVYSGPQGELRLAREAYRAGAISEDEFLDAARALERLMELGVGGTQ